jgi:hypothetical protein
MPASYYPPKKREEPFKSELDRNPYWSLDATVLKPALQAFFIAMGCGGFTLCVFLMIAYLRGPLTWRIASFAVLLGSLVYFLVFAVYLWIAFTDWNRFLYSMEKTFQADFNRDNVVGDPSLTITENRKPIPDYKPPIPRERTGLRSAKSEGRHTSTNRSNNEEEHRE